MTPIFYIKLFFSSEEKNHCNKNHKIFIVNGVKFIELQYIQTDHT